MTGFSLVIFNLTSTTASLFSQFWPNVRHSFFVSDVHFMFHTLESNPTLKSPNKDPLSYVSASKKSAHSPSTEPPSVPSDQTRLKDISSKKRPSLPRANDSDEDDTPALIRKKAVEQIQSPPNEGLAMVTYTSQSQYVNPIIMDYKAFVEMPVGEEPLRQNGKCKTAAEPKEQF
ncbi:hypothetical protein Adt_11395 [Abeliophyllum distichum]|uniref:Uncharacterized protein n=1 Tax=Abeliophyllum distichum TaxID=126358 RepID=A0ABD1UN23_9LAMI